MRIEGGWRVGNSTEQYLSVMLCRATLAHSLHKRCVVVLSAAVEDGSARTVRDHSSYNSSIIRRCRKMNGGGIVGAPRL